MALVEDASAPAPLTSITGGPGPTGVTTASFNPPAGSLILMVITSDATNVGNSATATVTDSLGNTFTPQVQVSASVTGYAGIFTKYLASAQTGYSVTVVLNSAQMQTATFSAGYIFQTFVITGANTVQNGSSVSGTGSGALSLTTTPTVLGSYMYGSTNDFSNGITFAPNAATTLKNSTLTGTGSGNDAWAIFRSTNSTSSLTGQTFGFTNADQHAIALYEVMPGITPATIAWLTA